MCVDVIVAGWKNWRSIKRCALVVRVGNPGGVLLLCARWAADVRFSGSPTRKRTELGEAGCSRRRSPAQSARIPARGAGRKALARLLPADPSSSLERKTLNRRDGKRGNKQPGRGGRRPEARARAQHKKRCSDTNTHLFPFSCARYGQQVTRSASSLLCRPAIKRR